jgi:hypothetical protein
VRDASLPRMTAIGPLNLGATLEKAAAKFRSRSDKRIARRNAADSPRASLFHYTTQNAFESIVTTQEFWLTSIYHMDDTEELNFGFDVCIEALRSFSKHTDNMLRLFLEALITSGLREDIRRIVEFYSMSFGTRDDQKQWECYGDKGKGVAFGLLPKFFVPIEGQKPEELTFVGKVIYGERSSKARHTPGIQSAIDFTKHKYRVGDLTTQELEQAFFQRLFLEMFVEILWNCVTTKSDSWQHQNEIRLLALNHTKNPHLPVHKRPNGQLYVKIPQPLLRLCLDEVIVGPKAENALEKKVRLFLTQQGLSDVRVTKSLAPQAASSTRNSATSPPSTATS